MDDFNLYYDGFGKHSDLINIYAHSTAVHVRDGYNDSWHHRIHADIWKLYWFCCRTDSICEGEKCQAFCVGNSAAKLSRNFNLLAIYLYYNLGITLERVWGTFRFNVYFFMGILGHVLAALLIYLLTGNVYLLTTDYLNFSLFFAFAATFPDMQFYLFFAIPIKAKWLAIFDGAYFLYGLMFGGMADRIAIIMSLLNFLIYFLMTRGGKYNPKEIRRKQQFRAQMREASQPPKQGWRHRCAVCGRTDADDPNLVFRYCSKCEGDYEYCQDHLYTHQHVTRGGMDPRQAENGQGNFSHK